MFYELLIASCQFTISFAMCCHDVNYPLFLSIHLTSRVVIPRCSCSYGTKKYGMMAENARLLNSWAKSVISLSRLQKKKKRIKSHNMHISFSFLLDKLCSLWFLHTVGCLSIAILPINLKISRIWLSIRRPNSRLAEFNFCCFFWFGLASV